MRITLIVAAAEGGVIGRGGDLPWKLPADLQRFKALTMGHHVVVGRKTWDSIGRPLPGRLMVVVSRAKPEVPEGVGVVSSVEEALAVAREAGDSEVFVAGGGEIYRLALPYAHRVLLTEVRAAVAGDVTFPELAAEEWALVRARAGRVDEANPLPHAFLAYDRVRPPEALP